jgi:hypothetical protein
LSFCFIFWDIEDEELELYILRLAARLTIAEVSPKQFLIFYISLALS